MVSLIKSILGETQIQALVGYETKADLILFLVTVLSFYFFIYPNFEKWNKKQIKTILKAFTPYLGAIAIVSSISAQTGTHVLSTTVTGLAIIFFAASIYLRPNIDSLKHLYPEITVGIFLTVYLLVQTQVPSFYTVFKLSALSIASILPVYLFLYLFDLRRDKMILFPVWAHFVDASSTVIALENSLTESRILASFFIDVFGPYGIFLMKSMVIIPITFFAVENLEEKYSLLAVYIVTSMGLILGVRNILLI